MASLGVAVVCALGSFGTHDGIDRIKQTRDLSDGNRLVSEAFWIGPGLRELKRVNGNGTVLSFLDDAGTAAVGYDAVKRITRLRVLGAGGGAPIVDRAYGYNRASMRTFEQRLDDGGLTDSYSYDSTYRVVGTQLDQGGSGTPRANRNLGYSYDGVGNRRQVVSDGKTESYEVNEVNEYTRVVTQGGSSPGTVDRAHSDNGNLLDDGVRTYQWDYKNRLVAVWRKDGTPLAGYLYYSDNRRARKVLFSETQPGVQTEAVSFFYDGWQVCEERTAVGTRASYVYSPVYVDEPVEVVRGVAHPAGVGVVYTHQNARADVVAVSNAAGAVVERRVFDDFGRGYDGAKQPVAESAVGNPYGFQGRRLDAETGLYYLRNRYYSVETGRFLQRDPVWDAGNWGGQYTFGGNGPISLFDPMGTCVGGRVPIGRSVHDARMKGFRDGLFSRQNASVLLSVTPFIGELKDAGEAITGRDIVAGKDLTATERAVTGVLVVAPFVGGALLRNAVKGGGDLIDAVRGVKRGGPTGPRGGPGGGGPGGSGPGGTGPGGTGAGTGNNTGDADDIIHRELRQEDLVNLASEMPIMAKAPGGTIIDQVQGRKTKYLSASETAKGTEKYSSGFGRAEISKRRLEETGSSLVPHRNVLTEARNKGTPLDVKNVKDSKEVLIKNGIDPSAVRNKDELVQRGYDLGLLGGN